MLDIEIFNARRGGSVLYKALAHPLAARSLAQLIIASKAAGSVAIYDPEDIASSLLALNPAFDVEGIYVHDTLAVGAVRAGHIARSVRSLRATTAATVLIASFGGESLLGRIAALVPDGKAVMTLTPAKLPSHLITNPRRYLDPVNFAVNFAFFRDDDHFGTRLTTANYWSAYGARSVRLYLRLYGQEGDLLAEWQQAVPFDAGSVSIDSREVRTRFSLQPFVGQLFIHAVGAAGHDVLKYALETFATDGGPSLSGTHDANAWPAERYAGLPAPLPGERVTLWLQNSHALAIPSGAIALDRMGAEQPIPITETVPPFATRAIDVSQYLPNVHWPSQIELRAGKYVVRPRYEVTRDARTRIAHVNVERSDLQADPAIATLSRELGRGYLLPFPVLPRGRFRTIVQPTPMAVSETNTPLRVDVFAPDGTRVASRYLGVLPRKHEFALDLDGILGSELLREGGHAELVYDFREGGDANGWLHALFRYEHRHSGHVAECSFGAHVYNTLMTYKDEPQSYSGSPPGLSTRLFLKLAAPERGSFCVLIYPSSAPWRVRSSTSLELFSELGERLESQSIEIVDSGSVILAPCLLFRADNLRAAGRAGYVRVRDASCRLFGFHGEMDQVGAFSFDHMFGF